MSLLLIKCYDITFISSHQIESSRVIDVILPIHLVTIKLCARTFGNILQQHIRTRQYGKTNRTLNGAVMASDAN